MMRKIGTPAKSRSPRKTPKRRKSSLAKKSAGTRKKSAPPPAVAGFRPSPRGKRGEKGYLAYLLRQAQAATRLTLNARSPSSASRRRNFPSSPC
jgi:hypothetical protein